MGQYSLEETYSHMSKLQIDSVQHSYSGRQILGDIYISCDTGEVVGLIGRNGSGKSTLFKIIARQLRAQYSHVRIDREVLRNTSSIFKQIYLRPQEYHIPARFKVEFAARLICDGHQVEKALSHPLIQPFKDRILRELSSGERRNIETVLALFSPAKFILLDEPFNGAAPINVEIIQELIHQVKSNKGIIITDHLRDYLLPICSKVYYLSDGSIAEIA